MNIQKYHQNCQEDHLCSLTPVHGYLNYLSLDMVTIMVNFDSEFQDYTQRLTSFYKS